MWSLPAEGMAKARAAARRAMELDPGLAEPWVSIAIVEYWHDWDWEMAERRFVHALELNPGYVFGLQTYALSLMYLGRLDEAIAMMERADAQDPVAVVSTHDADLGFLYARRGDTERALASWERALEIDPSSYTTHMHLGNHHCSTGDFEKGLRQLERARDLTHHAEAVDGDIGYCLAQAGRRPEAERLLAELEAQGRSAYVDPMNLAIIQVGLGELEAAFTSIDRALEVRATGLPMLPIDSRYEPLRSDPRYAQIVRTIGLTP